MTVPFIRRRARRPKVRTGCRTCRARHVKCGEEKPTCWNCARTGRECAGYDFVKTPERSSQLHMLQPKDASVALVPAVTHGLPSFPDGIHSTTGYEYFFCKAFQDLPGSSWALAWDRLILPFCHSEPAILYGAMAIGSLQHHRLACSDDLDVSSVQPTTALAQYGKSAGIIRNAIEKYRQKTTSMNDIETILTASLLWFCFEILHDQDDMANMHLSNGLRILHEHVGRKGLTNAIKNPGHERPIELSVGACSRMDLLIQTFVRLDADMTPLIEDTTFLSPICRQPVPSSFSSLDEAMIFIDVVQSQVFNIGRELDILAEEFLEATYPNFSFLDETVQEMLVLAKSRTVAAPIDLIIRMEEATEVLKTLMVALTALPSSDPPDARRMLVELHLFIVWFDASIWKDADEMEVDRFDQQFDHIMAIAEQYFAANEAEATNSTQEVTSRIPASKTRAAFQIGSSTLNTVCTIIEKSRNSTIRRRGIKLIAQMDMRGVFDAAFLAAYYQSVVDMEEDEARRLLGLPPTYMFHLNEIPAEARLTEVEVTGADDDSTDDGHNIMFYHRQMGRMVTSTARDSYKPVTQSFTTSLNPQLPFKSSSTYAFNASAMA
ncbi:hypothetical protein M409DRAFT_71262 [Zasmidium cellare ATCC 36951]|uniref:Zn(2)-C6 fungal-type domain-containing protein n=1 Tax=Zasmidium cellare ATCC 36951 TaxID=1080233 RepID=A0A6A6BWF6_ZASCE|nr:uncharacterized protein M409DRAFT_71262 [Zasmidium cellare ATCC 36951]KAF2159141.1 hypothetical protein M409DRAFT_71262 [Zasmidium cellare ATCC 36951]